MKRNILKDIVEYFQGEKKPEIHKACDFLPYYRREVIVQRANKNKPPFSAYLVGQPLSGIQYNDVYWKGTCGQMKDKTEVIYPDDTWYYAY